MLTRLQSEDTMLDSDDDNNDPGADFDNLPDNEILSMVRKILIAKKKKLSVSESKEQDYPDANHYFPTNFGLTFCVEEHADSVQAEFSFSRYHQITNPTEAKINIAESDYNKLASNLTFPLSEYLSYEDGKMFFKTTVGS